MFDYSLYENQSSVQFKKKFFSSAYWLGSTFFLFFITCLFLASAQADTHQLTVVNGSGSRLYEASAVVDIWANPYDDIDPNRTGDESPIQNGLLGIFDRWTGDTVHLNDVYAAHTKVIMPAADIIITPQYKTLLSWSPPRVITTFPPAYKGVIFLFHGGGGLGSWFFSITEISKFTNAAIAQGYALVTIDSFDQRDRQWDTTIYPEENKDLQRVKAVRDDLIVQGKMTADDSVYFVGLSNGGIFATLFDQVNQDALDFQVEAMALYISPGKPEIMHTTDVPTIFLLAENDAALNGGINSAALEGFNRLVSRDVPSQYWINPPSPLYPELFWCINGLSKVDSEIIYNALASGGLLDSEGFQIESPSLSGWQNLIPLEYVRYITQIELQLLVSNAEHNFMSEFNHKVFRFFENPTTIIDMIPHITGVSPENGVAGTTVVINGDNFVDILDVSFNGVATTFQVNSTTQIRTTVPSGATTGPLIVTNRVDAGISVTDFVVSEPVITDFSPDRGAWNTLVMIEGSGFVDITDVTIGGVSAPIISSFQRALYVRVPEGATTGPITISNPIGIATSATDFTLLSLPSIDSFSPFFGTIGSAVIINGVHFSDATSVSFAGVSAFFVVDSDNQISVTVPDGATAGKIRVTTAAGTGISADYYIAL
jgi:IPT/TIG domain.